MDFENVKWIRLFDITDTNIHHKGFIIYKVISMLYPVNCPEAITTITVWKRYNDFKKIYREMKLIHGKHHISEKFPYLPQGTIFKKYDKQALAEKKQRALNFLKFIGNHYQLVTSTEFVKFFETSYTPVDYVNGNINNIKADLNSPDDPEFAISSDDQVISDTDSVSTISCIRGMDLLETSITSLVSGDSACERSTKRFNNGSSQSSDNISTCTIENVTLLDGQIYSSTPRSPDSDEFYVQYIIDASVHIKIAEELENTEKFEESFVTYKTAIDILLRHGKNEGNYDRKRLVRYKTEKYLLRAEKLYNMYLAPEIRNLQPIIEKMNKKNEVQSPEMSDLYKYNVLRVIDTGMLVVHSDSQKIFYVKVIHKTAKFLDDNLILPENVPYMAKLHNYYNCDNALFLVLEYVNGSRLSDYLKKLRMKSNENDVLDKIFDEVNNPEISEDESEKSFSDLINKYAKEKNDDHKGSDGSFEEISIEDISPDYSKNIMDQPLLNDPKTKLERCFDSGSNKSHISRRKSSTLSSMNTEPEQNWDIPDEENAKWLAQLILALEKLHILGITCIDILNRNLLIDDEGNLILTFMCNVKDLCDIYNNTRDLGLAPELHGIATVGQDADWWSLGAILYELLVGTRLNDHSQFFSSSTILTIPKYVSPEGRSLLRQLLVYEPKDRLGAGTHGIEKLKSHPFFRRVDWNALADRWKI